MESSEDTLAAEPLAADLASGDTIAAGQDRAVTQPARAPSVFSRGMAVGRYVILAKLGAGGMGVVYAAYDPELDRKVALKMLHTSEGVGSRATQGRARLLREAQALAKFSHPEIVAIHDVGEHESCIWIAMEFVEGRTLAEWAREEKPRWQDVLGVMQAAGRGVAAAHAMGLVHRDLKPDNIMFASDGRVRVMDFGLTRGRRKDGPGSVRFDAETVPGMPERFDLTQQGSLLGTPGYMAPEQWSGDEVGEAADQFAFAVTTWELLYGQRPFSAPSLMELGAAVVAGKRRPPPPTRKVPSWLRRALERALSPDPQKRWPSMRALLDELARGRVRTRNRLVALGVSISLAIAAAVPLELTRRERNRVATCDAKGAEIDAIWTPDMRQQIEAAMSATKLPYASTTNERVQSMLNERAREWSTTRRDACLQGIDADDRATWCFDERAMEIAALVEELAVADALVVQKAVNAVVALPRIEGCADIEQLERRPPPPPLEQRDAVAELHRKIARAATLDAAGQYGPALELAEATLAEAEAAGWSPLVAASRARVARILDAKGESTTAYEVGTQAYFEAVDAAWPEKAAEIAAWLWTVAAIRLSRVDADLWGQLAESGMRSAGIPEGDVRWLRLSLDRGAVFWARGRRQEAVDNNREAVAEIEALLGPDHPDIARGLNVVGNALHKLNRPEEAREAFVRALEIREHAFGPDHPEVANSMSNLANALASMEHYEESVKYFDRAIEVSTKAVGERHPMTATIINNSFFPLQGLGHLDEAANRLKRAIVLRSELLGPIDSWTQFSRGHLADVYREARDWEALRRAGEEALEVHRQAGGTPGTLAHWELDILEADLELGRLEGLRERLDRCESAVATGRPAEWPPDIRVPMLRARLALAEGNLAEARKLAEHSLSLCLRHSLHEVAVGQLELAKVLAQIPQERDGAIILAKTARRGFEAMHADGRTGRDDVDVLLDMLLDRNEP